MADHYWDFFIATKHKACYYKSFYSLFSRINWAMTAFLNFASFSSIAAWGIWNDYSVVWAAIIGISQVLQMLFPKVPYNDLLISVKFILPEIDRLLIDIENDYFDIELGRLSDDDIKERLNIHQIRLFDITSRYFGGVYLPDLRFCASSAERDCKNYFSVNYKI